MVSFLECLVFFATVFFCTEELWYSCRIRMVFGMFLPFLNVDSYWPFCKGLSLCMGYSFWKRENFKYRLISRIFKAFSSSFFFAQNNCNVFVEWFSHFFTFLVFDLNWPSCKGYSRFLTWFLTFVEHLVFLPSCFSP